MTSAAVLPVIAFASLLPLVFWPPFEDAFKLPQHACLLLFAAWLPGWGRRNAAELLRRPEVPALIAVIWLSAAVAPAGGRAGDLATITALGITGWLLPPLLRGRPRVRVLPALALAGTVSAGYSVWQFAVGDPAGGMTTRGLRPFSTMGNPDFLAAFLAAVMPWQIATWIRTGAPLWAAAAGATGAAVLVAQSRGAWLALAAATAVFLAARRAGRAPAGWPRRAVVGAAAAVLAAGMFLSLHAPTRERALAMFRTGHFDAAGRFAMWRASAVMIADRPVLGHGPGSYGRIHPGYHARIMARDVALPWFWSENAHNDLLQAGAETGLLGLGGVLWWLVCFARLAWLAHRRGDPDGLPVLAGLAGTCVNALVNFPWYLIPTLGWAWLAYAVLAARHVPADAPPAVGRREDGGWWRAIRLGAVAFALGRMFVANGWLKLAGDAGAGGRWLEAASCARQADRVWLGWEGRGRAAGGAASAAWGAGDWAASESWARRALESDPESPAFRHQLGLALARLERYPESERAVRSALAVNPRMAEAWHTLGNLAWLRRDRAGAAAAWRTALSLNPGLEAARQSLGALEAGRSRRNPVR